MREGPPHVVVGLERWVSAEEQSFLRRVGANDSGFVVEAPAVYLESVIRQSLLDLWIGFQILNLLKNHTLDGEISSLIAGQTIVQIGEFLANFRQGCDNLVTPLPMLITYPDVLRPLLSFGDLCSGFSTQHSC